MEGRWAYWWAKWCSIIERPNMEATVTSATRAKCVHADHPDQDACGEHIYVSVEGVNNPGNNKGMWPFHCILVKAHTGPHKACSWETCDLVNWDISTLYAERDASRKDMN